jgi:hypothetical protein
MTAFGRVSNARLFRAQTGSGQLSSRENFGIISVRERAA